jgi:hypothetical protein
VVGKLPHQLELQIELPPPVGPLHPLPKTYAQVVQGNHHTNVCRTVASLGAPPSTRRSSPSVERRRRVLFAESPSMAVFLKGSIPTDIFLLGRPTLSSKAATTKLKLRSCLKSSYGYLSIMPSRGVTNHPSVQGISQEQSEEIPPE